MDRILRRGPLVEVVDVLRAKRQSAASPGNVTLKVDERPMGGVGLRGEKVAPTEVIEVLNNLRCALECLWRREAHPIEMRPEPYPGRVSKSFETARRRNARPRQHEYANSYSLALERVILVHPFIKWRI
jgi:hypothetical protein